MGVHSCVLDPTLKREAPMFGGRYGRLFPDLAPPHAALGPTIDLGIAGSPMDDVLAEDGPMLANPRIPAGFAIFGQFIAHDLTHDQSLLAHHEQTGTLRNFHAPRLDLEPLYGISATSMPFLYDLRDGDKLLLGRNDAARPDDLPRNQQGRALTGDPRNDVHLPIAQLHVAFIKFHNHVVDRLRAEGLPAARIFGAAQRLVRWHYQWIVAHEFLTLSVGEALLEEIAASGRRFYDFATHPFLPVEFADAAYRFGHSQIAPGYRLNDTLDVVPLFPDLLGGRPVRADHVIDWSWFFAFPGRHAPQPSRRIVPALTHVLITLPDQIVGAAESMRGHSLAVRDLERGRALALPSGEAIARAMGVTPLTEAECGLRAAGWETETPLWYYVLREAEVRAGGAHLGPVGGRIVAEVLSGLLDADADSYRQDADWRPTLPAARSGDFTMADLLRLAETV